MTRKIPLSILSAVLLVLAFPPFSYGFAAWFSFVPLLWALDGAGKKQGFALGYIYGFVFFLGTVNWVIHSMYHYGGVPMSASVLVMLTLVAYLSLFPAFFGLFFAASSGSSVAARVILAPSLWVSAEYLRGYLFTGLPWAVLGYTQAHYLPLIQIADNTGVWGISFLVVAANAAIYFLARAYAKKERLPVGEALVVALLVASTAIYGFLTIRNLDKDMPSWSKIKAGVLQGSIDQGVKWDKSYQQKTLDIYRALSVNAARAGAHLLVWPETAVPFYLEADKVKDGFIGDIVRETGSYLLTGSPSYNYNRGSGTIEYFNSAYLISPDAEVRGRYDKVHLVPFGEYVPLKSILPFEKLTAGVGDFTSGPGPLPIKFEGGGIGVLVCFESIFPELARHEVKNGATVLVNITNDGWFGRTAAPYQHFEMSILRAAENKIFLLRSANTGISAIIDPVGRVRKKTRLFEKAALVDEIGLRRSRPTFYTAYGDVFTYFCFAVSAFFVFNVLKSTGRGQAPEDARSREPRRRR